MIRFPSFEEFDAEVKNLLRDSLRVFDKKEVEDYLNNEETKCIIKERYEEFHKEFDSGELGNDVTLRGLAGSPASCLYLMF